MSPLALMICPRGSSLPSFARARIGAGRYSGFQAFSVGSHHFVGALDVGIASAGENSLSNSLAFVQAATGRPIVLAAPRHQHEDDARDLVGERRTAVRLNLYLTPVLRSSIPLAHRRKASLWPRRWRSVAQAPTTRSLRR